MSHSPRPERRNAYHLLDFSLKCGNIDPDRVPPNIRLAIRHRENAFACFSCAVFSFPYPPYRPHFFFLWRPRDKERSSSLWCTGIFLEKKSGLIKRYTQLVEVMNFTAECKKLCMESALAFVQAGAVHCRDGLPMDKKHSKGAIL